MLIFKRSYPHLAQDQFVFAGTEAVFIRVSTNKS